MLKQLKCINPINTRCYMHFRLSFDRKSGYKLSFLLLFTFLIPCTTELACVHYNDKDIIKSAGSLISQYYKDYLTADEKVIAKHYASNFKKDYFEHLVRVSKIYQIERIEIMKTNILHRDPLTVEIEVKEWYKPEVFPPPFYVLTYVLRSKNGLEWEIIRRTEPGLP